MLKVKYFGDFSHDYNTCKKIYGNDNLKYLDAIIITLAKGHKLAPKYKDHPLTRGKWKNKNYRDCHIVEVTED
jgi:addiction module RelE/StbE family toxin